MKIRPAVLAISFVLAGAFTLGSALTMQAQDKKPQQQPSPAQQKQQPPPTQQSPTQQIELSQSQLESFASAALQLREIRSSWQSRLQGAESAEKAQEMQAQATAEMVSAVEAKGLTVETYNTIATAARDNPELADRIAQIMEKAR